MMLIYKIQGIKIASSPFQRRRKLATLTLYGASGSMMIPDIANERALALKNYMLYKLETAREKWM